MYGGYAISNKYVQHKSASVVDSVTKRYCLFTVMSSRRIRVGPDRQLDGI